MWTQFRLISPCTSTMDEAAFYWCVILRQPQCLFLIMELVFNILSTGMPSEVPVLLQGLISLAVWKAFVGAYWLWREFAPVGAIREQRQRTTAACVQKWWGCSQWGRHQIHDQRWQHSEAGVLSWCQVIFEAVGGSQKCTWLIAECPCLHGGYNAIPIAAQKAAKYNS